MSKYVCTGSKLTAIGDAIRAKTGGTDTLTLDQMASAIGDLHTTAQLTFSTVRGTVPATEDAHFAVPTAPSATGYGFVGWYADAELTTEYDWNAAAATSTVYGKWSINAPTVNHPDIQIDGTTEYTLGTVTAKGDGQTVEYSSDGSTWATTCPKASAEGTYTTYWRITAEDCDVLTGSFTTKLSADPVTDAIVTKLTAAASSRSLSALSYDELSLVGQSLTLLGTGSKAYSAALACAKAGAYRTTTYNSTTVYMTLIGVLHSTDANGKTLGLDFMMSKGAPTTSALMGTSDGVTTMVMNSSGVNTGGWGASDGRTTLNSTIYGNLASDLKAVIRARHVPYGPTYNSTSSSVSYTDDNLWLLSYGEVYGAFNAWQKSEWTSEERPWIDNEGSQMAWFANAGVSTSNYSKLAGGSTYRWLRSCHPTGSSYFGRVYYSSGLPYYDYASFSRTVFPCFSI